MRRTDREITDRAGIVGILEGAKILHLGLFDEGYPYVVPLHFGYSWDGELPVFYMHGALEGHKLDLLRADPRAFVELECGVEPISGGEIPCKYGAAYASVMVRGMAELVEDPAEKLRGLSLLMAHQTGRSFAFSERMAASVAVIRVTAAELTAKARPMPSMGPRKPAPSMTPADPMLEDAVRYIRTLFCNDAGGHDAEHSLRVWRNAMHLADAEHGCDRRIVSLAALLHDADDPKLFSTENNANARAFLASQPISEAETERIVEIINGVSFRHNRDRRPPTLEGQIVQDADRLDAMGAVGIARTFAYGGAHGRPMEESIRHFYDKLLRLRDGMNTPAARQEAASRHALLTSFLSAWYTETGEPEEGGAAP